MCTGGCPISIKSGLNVRRLVRELAIFKDYSRISEEQLWGCTTCSTCELRCPKEISPVNVLLTIRSLMVETGKVPPTLRDALESVYMHGNPWTRARTKRTEWAEGLSIKHASEKAEILYFVGCTPAYDTRVQEVARAFAKCLAEAKVDFSILGTEENCCGNEIYGMGETGLFELLMEENKKLFDKYGVERIVTTCPHGFNALKNMYNGLNAEVIHHTQLLLNLIEERKIKLNKEVNATVIYHDPCFLGKRNGIFDEPRRLLESIPGVKLIEFERNKSRSLCCEGGGGRMWFDIPGTRLAELRATEAAESGADIIAVSCPFCLLTITDAVKTTGLEEKIQVLDVAEILLKAISK